MKTMKLAAGLIALFSLVFVLGILLLKNYELNNDPNLQYEIASEEYRAGINDDGNDVFVFVLK